MGAGNTGKRATTAGGMYMGPTPATKVFTMADSAAPQQASVWLNMTPQKMRQLAAMKTNCADGGPTAKDATLPQQVTPQSDSRMPHAAAVAASSSLAMTKTNGICGGLRTAVPKHVA